MAGARRPGKPQAEKPEGAVTVPVYVTDETGEIFFYDVGDIPLPEHLPLLGAHCFEPVAADEV